jgi:hypothetical protein
MSDGQGRMRWFIDADWLERHDRSLLGMAQGCLCADCVAKQKKAKKPPTASGVIATITSCCAHKPDFIPNRMPLMESIFHIFLANGNEPLDLGEIGSQLAGWRGNNFCISESTLFKLLTTDRYYGIRPAP